MVVGDNKFHAKAQLRLLRVRNAFCQPAVPQRIVVEVATLGTIDPLLYVVLGDGSSGSRATIQALVVEEGSLLAHSQQRLSDLAQSRGPRNDQWSLAHRRGTAQRRQRVWVLQQEATRLSRSIS